jgi:hypothetical protein
MAPPTTAPPTECVAMPPTSAPPAPPSSAPFASRLLMHPVQTLSESASALKTMILFIASPFSWALASAQEREPE